MDPSEPPSSSSVLLKDISNFKTPRRPSQRKPLISESPNVQFFMASKQTPCSLSRASTLRSAPRSFLASRSRSKTAAVRRLKAFEVEQSQSSRKVQLQKERSHRTLSKSLTVWLNFLFQNPSLCGCGSSCEEASPGLATKGKRESGPGTAVGFEPSWRIPKRQRDMLWQNPEERGCMAGFSSFMFVKLRDSLKEICSFDDLTERMRVYLSLDSCKEIFSVMTQVTKSIDGGRLNMKPHCPIISDFGMKKKAIKVLLCYNPDWLRIGLYIILGGDSLLPNGDLDHNDEIAFLKMIIEKQFLSHAGLAKSYAYNKKVEGLFRPGYYENLGNVILKRFLLLVLVLDRAKAQSSLSLKYGIDGIDGGSPLLFNVQSSVKSSSQVISDFLLSDVMHGEGNLLAHLLIVGFKVSYEQSPLIEYDFRLTDVSQDLQDGVRLCRAVQLLKQDPSILMKLKVPSDTHKKSLANCAIVFQHLKLSGVPLHDEDGMMIEADDIANGDRELTLALVWNMFAHLQLPLLINEKLIADEVIRIGGVVSDKSLGTSSTSLDTLFCWIKAIGEKYELKIENQNSLTDGKAVWCLLDYYFHKELHCPCPQKEAKSEGSIVSAGDYADAVHNFVLSQRLATLLGNFPEVLEIGDILEHQRACNGRSVVILLVFLAYQLIIRKNMHELNFHKLLDCTCQSTERQFSGHERLRSNSKEAIKQEDKDFLDGEEAARRFKAILGWWQEMAETNFISMTKPDTSSNGLKTGNFFDKDKRENAARIIQSCYRGSIAHRKFLQTMEATCLLQKAIRAWLLARLEAHKENALLTNAATKIQTAWKNFVFQNTACVHHSAAISIQRCLRGWISRRGYLVQKRSAIRIQRAFRHLKSKRLSLEARDVTSSAIIIQSYVRRWIAQRWICKHKFLILQIQSHCRGWLTRRNFLSLRDAAITLQSAMRCHTSSKLFQLYRHAAIEIQCFVRVHISRKRLIDASVVHERSVQTNAATKIWIAWKKFVAQNTARVHHSAAINIQQCLRGWISRRAYSVQKRSAIKIQRAFRHLKSKRLSLEAKALTSSAIIIQSYVRRWITQRWICKHKFLIFQIQSHCRGWLTRRNFFSLREAAITLQSAIRCHTSSKLFQQRRHAATEIQCFVRMHISQKRLLEASAVHERSLQNSTSHIQTYEIKILSSVVKLQRWWRSVLLLKVRSAVVLQSYARGWFARREAARERHRVVLIQSFWKGYLARKESHGQLLDLRLRVQKTAANVDDSMRLINRLTAALPELLNVRSIRSILHICSTLDLATQHSQKCCEKLIEAGAIDKLLKLIHSVNRSIPDQEVLKHTLSTLRNLARYPDSLDALIHSNGLVETMYKELLRNKEGYFIASELLKKICSKDKGLEIVRKSPVLLKRLRGLVEELTRRVDTEKRSARSVAARENTERRLKEAAELLKMVSV